MQSTTIVFTGKDQVEVHHESASEPKSQELLLETKSTLISAGTELICLRRKFEQNTHWDSWVQYPFYPGYSHVGRVVAMGAEVTGFAEGDRVFSRSRHAQWVCAPANAVFSVPDAISDEDATWAGLASIVQHGVRKAQLRMGEIVVVIGLGMLGQLAVQYARLSGAGEVIAIDTIPARLEIAAAHGATHVVAGNVRDALPAILEFTGGRLADAVFDITGHPAVLPDALKLLRRFGRLILTGDTGTPSEQHLTSDLITRDLQLIGAHDSNVPPQAGDYTPWPQAEMIRLFFRYLERGQMRVSDLITHCYSPGQAVEAYQMLAQNPAGAMGTVFQFSPKY